jgi:hypothetical protein
MKPNVLVFGDRDENPTWRVCRQSPQASHICVDEGLRRSRAGLSEALTSGATAANLGLGRFRFSVNPKQGLPSVRNTSMAGKTRLLKPIKRQA